MPNDPTKFKLDLRKWAEQANVQLDTALREVCFDLFEEVMEATPVDLGFLKGSWFSSIGAPAPGPEGQNDPTGARTIAQVASVIANADWGDRVYFLNNAVYAAAQEFGVPERNIPPQMYVRGTLSRARQIAKATLQRIAKP